MSNMINPQMSAEERVKIAKRCTWIGFAVNGILSVLKIIAGMLGRSGAMIADGIHSASDFVTDVLVVVFLGISARGDNKDYRYGHGKFETFATFLISVALIVVAVGIFIDGFRKVASVLNGEAVASPTMIALVMALVSIVAKEGLFRYTSRVGKRLDSAAVIANAWHHRSDAYSSIATLIGIGGAMLLGNKWVILDPLVAMLVSVFIAFVAMKIGIPAVKDLLEVALPEEVDAQARSCIASTPGVITFHQLRSRRNGMVFVFDFHIKVDPDISVTEAHHISTEVEHNLREQFPQCIVYVHIEPYRQEHIHPDGSCVD